MSRMCRNCFSPAPRGPSRFSSGTRQSLNASGRVSEAFQPIFRYGSPCVYPSVPLGTIRFEISLWASAFACPLPFASAAPVTAVMQTIPEMFGARVGDELLCSVDHPLAAVEARPRARVARIGPRFGLGQAERAEPLARAQPGHPLALLLL